MDIALDSESKGRGFESHCDQSFNFVIPKKYLLIFGSMKHPFILSELEIEGSETERDGGRN